MVGCDPGLEAGQPGVPSQRRSVGFAEVAGAQHHVFGDALGLGVVRQPDAGGPHRIDRILATGPTENGVAAALAQGRQQVEAAALLLADQIVVLEAHGARGLGDRHTRSVHGRDPLGQLIGIRHGGTQGHQPNVSR